MLCVAPELETWAGKELSTEYQAMKERRKAFEERKAFKDEKESSTKPRCRPWPGRRRFSDRLLPLLSRTGVRRGAALLLPQA